MNSGNVHKQPIGIAAPPQTWWQTVRYLGPGLIISANIVGSGELIITTQLGAQVGFQLLWFIVLSCFIKVFVQIELGRFTITEGLTPLQALNLLPGPRLIVSWIIWFWAVMYIGTIVQMSGMINAIGALFGDADEQGYRYLAGVIVPMLVIAASLHTGRYRVVEAISIAMVAIFTIATIGAVVALQWTEFQFHWSDVADGLTLRPPESLAMAIAVFGVTGVGAAELIFYPYWCLEKGYAARVGPSDESPQWRERAKGWMRVLYIDAWLSMVVYTAGTLAFYLLGAAILHGQKAAVTDSELIMKLSTIYSEAFGSAGVAVFIAGAFLVLFSTLFVSTASNARLFSDGANLLGLLPDSKRPAATRIACVGIPVLIVAIALAVKSYLASTVNRLVFLGATGQALMLPLLGIAALYFLHCKSDSRLRPGFLWSVFVWIAVLLISGLGLYAAGVQLKVWQ